MKTRLFLVGILIALLSLTVWAAAQQTAAAPEVAVVPKVINYSGVLTALNDKPLSGIQGVTFLLYSSQEGGAPLWLETQNVMPGRNGQYTATLGTTTSQGLPSNLFTSGEARWLAVQVAGQPEQPRLLLVAVPYALKAADAATIGGLPPSAFVLAAPPSSGSGATTDAAPVATANSSVSPATTSDVTTTGGTVDAIPLFSTATNIQNSLLTQAGKTAINIAGKLTLPATGTATSSAGKNSQSQDFVASAFNSSSSAAVAQTFQFQAEPAGNDTASPSGTLNLLYGSGTATPAETGLKIASNGRISFASGQTFPGTGDGTITGVTAGTDLTGGGTSGTVTLNLNTAALNSAYAQLVANNTFIGIQTIDNITTISGTNSSGMLQVTNTGTSGANPAIVGTTDSTAAAAVKGVAPATSGTSNGVLGVGSSPHGNGVKGQGPNVGVYGQSSGASTTGAYSGNAGVWGDTGGGSEAFSGVLGSADDNNAGSFVNNSGSDTTIGGVTLYAENFTTDGASLVFFAAGAFSGDSCTIDVDGDLSCSGTVGGAVRAGDSARNVMVHAVQSPENWFEDFGSGTLAHGAATVALDPTFASTVNTTADYHVFLTPKGDCQGLYVTNETATSFGVRELGAGGSNVAFDYRIVAKRAGYENQRLEDVTERYQKMHEDQRLRRERMQKRRAAQAAAAPISPSAVSGR